MRSVLAQPLPQFLAAPHPAPASILHPWLHEGGITMLYGARGGGKTGVSLALALACACGTSLLNGMYAPKPRKVLYVDGEMHPSEVEMRLRKFLAGMPGVWPSPNFHYLSQAFVEQGIPDLGETGGSGQRLLEHEIAASHAELVILDNISALFRSGEENSNDSWVGPATWLLGLRRQNIATLLIHHAGKRDIEGRLRQRGASKREDALDAVLQIDETAKPRDGRLPLKLTYEKCRSFTPAEHETHFSLVYDDEAARAWIEDGNWQRKENAGRPGIGEPPKWLDKARELEALGVSIRKIGEEVGATKSSVHRWLTGREMTVADACDALAE
jgi:hypothetical protein